MVAASEGIREDLPVSEKTDLSLVDDLLEKNAKLVEENTYLRTEVANLMMTLNKSCISSGKVIHGLRGTIAALQQQIQDRKDLDMMEANGDGSIRTE